MLSRAVWVGGQKIYGPQTTISRQHTVAAAATKRQLVEWPTLVQRVIPANPCWQHPNLCHTTAKAASSSLQEYRGPSAAAYTQATQALHTTAAARHTHTLSLTLSLADINAHQCERQQQTQEGYNSPNMGLPGSGAPSRGQPTVISIGTSTSHRPLSATPPEKRQQQCANVLPADTQTNSRCATKAIRAATRDDRQAQALIDASNLPEHSSLT